MQTLLFLLTLAILLATLPGCSAEPGASSTDAGRSVPEVDAIVSPLMEAAREMIGHSASHTDWPNVERTLKRNLHRSEVFRSLDDEYLFFLGSDCSGDVRGSFGARSRGEESVNAKQVSWFANDDVSSVLIRNAAKGETIHLYDHPQGLDAQAGYTLIRIHRDVLTPICVGTFEASAWLPNQEDPVVEIAFNGRGALDGKVSRVANSAP